ncbi:MAG: methylmalonyl Co-A mutase-associated GTPase MeaB [Planctomycetes bacterium]|nr:methylmalonyl Co-A mutase-associated GTPase MeaB [Planctomycetota bacterium]
MPTLLERVAARETRAVSRALTLAENADTAFLSALDAAWPSLPQPQRIGITGPPGAGKSTLTDALVAGLRARGSRVAVVAVDPSSPFTGGALLGDRLRMARHTLDPDVFVRSMASRGHFGGLAAGTEDACDVLALAGFDPVLVETVGVGQSEVEIARLADTTLVVLTPASGDSVQALKAGLMEAADVVVINKADRPGAERMEEDVREALSLRPHPPAGQPLWLPPVVRTVATEGTGTEATLEAIAAHQGHLVQHGLLQQARAARAERRLAELAAEALRASLLLPGPARDKLDQLRAQVAQGKLSPRAAAAELVQALGLRAGAATRPATSGA